MSSKDITLSSISLLTSENYHLWDDHMKTWLQLNGLWCLVSSLEEKPAAQPAIKDSSGQILSPAVPLDWKELKQ